MKHDVSNIIKAAYDRGISIKTIAATGLIGQATLYRAMNGGLVGSTTKKSIVHAVDICSQEDDVAFNQGHEVSTEQLAANLEKQVDELRDTVAFSMSDFMSADQMPKIVHVGLPNTPSGLVDDQLESAHSREVAQLKADLACTEKRHDDAQDLLFFERKKNAELQTALVARISEVENIAADLAHERLKNETQYQSIGQCFAEIHRLQGELNHQKLITASRNADLVVYQKELEDADNRADDAEYKAAEFERGLNVQRAWTCFFVLLAFVVAVVGAVK